MPITYRLEVAKSLIITRCVGHVTLPEVQEHFRELARVWPPVIHRLDVALDLTDQTSLPTLPQLEAVEKEIEAQIGPRKFGRCAVITEMDLLYGSMQMLQVLVGRLFDAIEVFRTPEAALMWLMPAPKKKSAGLRVQ